MYGYRPDSQDSQPRDAMPMLALDRLLVLCSQAAAVPASCSCKCSSAVLDSSSSLLLNNATHGMPRCLWLGSASLHCVVTLDDKVKLLKEHFRLGAGSAHWRPWMLGSWLSKAWQLHKIVLLNTDAGDLTVVVKDGLSSFRATKKKTLQFQDAGVFREQPGSWELKRINQLDVVASTNDAGKMASLMTEINLSENTAKSVNTMPSMAQNALDAVVIAFDIETTGFKVSDDRIVEFAARDLAGGDCSTLQTLVNPGMPIPIYATNVHGISTEMVTRSGIPRWKEVAPILVQFVETRRQSRPVILVAHNGRRFDVPFLIQEFQRCSMEIPSWWRFLDTVPLAREAMKSRGLTSYSLRLSSLHAYYKLPFAGQAHRALADVHMLASVLQRVSIDLKMPVSILLEKSFAAGDISKLEN